MNQLITVVRTTIKQLTSVLLMWIFTAIAFVFLAISTVFVSMLSLVTGIFENEQESPKFALAKAVKHSSVPE